MPALVSDVARLGRFASATWKLLDGGLTLERSHAMVAGEVAQREQLFVRLVEGILAQPATPFARLLAHAGIVPGETATLVADHGVEGTLARLYDDGVYITSAELRGETPLRRGSLEVDDVPAGRAAEPGGSAFVARSGGSTGAPRAVRISLEYTDHGAAHVVLFLHAFGLAPRPAGLWYPSPPGVAGLVFVLQHLRAGWPLERWFAQTRWIQRGLESSAATTLAASAASRLRRRPMPFPRYTPPADAERVARWVAARAAAGTPVYLGATPSSAVRVCKAAAELGLDISGTMFRSGGEPLTPAKARTIADAGARVGCFYHAAEMGLVGTPCGNATAVGDVHAALDRIGLLTRAQQLADGSSVDALVLTNLVPAGRPPLLNWVSGDTATVEERTCGCEVERAGLGLHLHTIRSYDKLTAEGMSFADGALVTLVEEILPERFGGAPDDFQFVEREEDGATRMVLRVSPRLGPLDEQAVVDVALGFLASRGGAERAMAAVWRGAATVAVVRVDPHVTPASKTPALYRER